MVAAEMVEMISHANATIIHSLNMTDAFLKKITRPICYFLND